MLVKDVSQCHIQKSDEGNEEVTGSSFGDFRCPIRAESWGMGNIFSHSWATRHTEPRKWGVWKAILLWSPVEVLGILKRNVCKQKQDEMNSTFQKGENAMEVSLSVQQGKKSQNLWKYLGSLTGLLQEFSFSHLWFGNQRGEMIQALT